MATSQITNTITDPSDGPVSGVRVVARLLPVPGFRVSDSSEIAESSSAVTNGSGVWTLDLERQSNITPANTFYEVTEYVREGGRTQRRVWNISVPDSNAELLDCLITPPTANPTYDTATGVVTPAIDAHEIDPAAHSGTYVAYLTDLVGDGTTDDYTTLQAALTAVPESGGTLILPVGTFIVSDTLYVKSNTTLRGSGPFSSIIKRKGGTYASDATASATGKTSVITCGPSAGTAYSTGTRGQGIVFEDLGIDGNKAGQTIPGSLTSSNTFAHGISALRVDSIAVRNCRIANTIQTGIYVFGSQRVDIRGCELVDCGSTHANLDGLSRNGISMSGNTTTDPGNTKVYRVTDCYVSGAADEGIQYGYAQDVIISGNHVYSPGKKGIEGDTAFPGGENPPGNIQIIGNYIRDTGQVATTGAQGISIGNANNQKILVANNTLINLADTGIDILQADESTFNIIGNIIEGVGGGYAVGTADSKHGIYVEGHKIRIADNQIYDISGAGIACSLADSADVVDNHVQQVLGNGIQFTVGATEVFKVVNASGNSLDTIDGHGLSVGGTAGGAVNHLVANNNTMQNIALTGSSSHKNGMDIRTLSIRRLSVCGNTITDQRSPADMGSGLDISGTASVADATVTGNMFAPGGVRGFNGRTKVTRLTDVSNTWDSSGGGAVRQAWRTSPPTASQGAFLAGDMVYNSAPAVGEPLGWVCTSAGTPGTWTPFFVGGAYVRKLDDETVTSSSALQNDDELVLPVVADAVYDVDAFLIYDGSTAGDFKFGFTGPAGATLDWYAPAQSSGGTSTSGSVSILYRTLADSLTAGAAGSGTKLVVRATGLLIVGSTAGNLTVQFAQGTSDGTATTMFANSWLRLTRVS